MVDRFVVPITVGSRFLLRQGYCGTRTRDLNP
jgi:hypothetical protein